MNFNLKRLMQIAAIAAVLACPVAFGYETEKKTANEKKSSLFTVRNVVLGLSAVGFAAYLLRDTQPMQNVINHEYTQAAVDFVKPGTNLVKKYWGKLVAKVSSYFPRPASSIMLDAMIDKINDDINNLIKENSELREQLKKAAEKVAENAQ